MAAATAARTGGRTQQGTPPANPAVRHVYDYPVRPTKGKPPPGPPGAVPRTGGRTQQGARQQSRTGGRTQQGTQGGAEVPPASTPVPEEPETITRTGGGSGVAADSYGAILAIFAYPLFLNLLRGGPSGAKAWLKAKFVNQPAGTASPPGLSEQGGFISLGLPGTPAAPPPVLGPTGQRPL